MTVSSVAMHKVSRAAHLAAAGSSLLSSLEEAEAEADKVSQHLMDLSCRVINTVATVCTVRNGGSTYLALWHSCIFNLCHIAAHKLTDVMRHFFQCSRIELQGWITEHHNSIHKSAKLHRSTSAHKPTKLCY